MSNDQPRNTPAGGGLALPPHVAQQRKAQQLIQQAQQIACQWRIDTAGRILAGLIHPGLSIDRESDQRLIGDYARLARYATDALLVDELHVISVGKHPKKTPEEGS